MPDPERGATNNQAARNVGRRELDIAAGRSSRDPVRRSKPPLRIHSLGERGEASQGIAPFASARKPAGSASSFAHRGNPQSRSGVRLRAHLRRTAQRRADPKPPWRLKDFADFSLKPSNRLVGVRGFEPPTPSSRTRCATRLRYTPTSPREAAGAVYRGAGRAAQASRGRPEGPFLHSRNTWFRLVTSSMRGLVLARERRSGVANGGRRGLPELRHVERS